MSDESTTRTDAWETELSPEQRDRIFERLLQKFEPAKVAEWIEKEFSAPQPSRSALYRFRDRWRRDYEQRRNARVLLACQTTETLIAQEGAVSDATRAQARALALEAAMRGDFESGQRWANLAARITSERGGMVELDIKVKAEARAREELEIERQKLQIRLQESESKIAAAAAALDKTRTGELDPGNLADEMDRILGRRKPA
jgi:hypothetical protein